MSDGKTGVQVTKDVELAGLATCRNFRFASSSEQESETHPLRNIGPLLTISVPWRCVVLPLFGQISKYCYPFIHNFILCIPPEIEDSFTAYYFVYLCKASVLISEKF